MLFYLNKLLKVELVQVGIDLTKNESHIVRDKDIDNLFYHVGGLLENLGSESGWSGDF